MTELQDLLANRRSHHLMTADVFNALDVIPEGHVQCVVTSPPYWAQRDYGHPDQIGSEPLHDCLAWASAEDPCGGCYVCTMREVAFRLWGVLRDDGTFWLNLGDSSATGGGHTRQGDTSQRKGCRNVAEQLAVKVRKPAGLRQKNMCLVPQRVALALQADGWFVRQEIVWCKSSPQPESCRDRPTSAHEKIYLLTKKPGGYYYDMEAERVKQKPSTLARDRHTRVTTGKDGHYAVQHDHETPSNPSGRNLWNYWTDVPTSNFGWEMCEACGAIIDNATYRRLPLGTHGKHVCECGQARWLSHFAVFPPGLPTRCIRLGTSEQGCCPLCRKPWQRTLEHVDDVRTRWSPTNALAQEVGGTHTNRTHQRVLETAGWRKTCECPSTGPVPCLVLDPFSGGGTTVLAALRLGRRGLGVELNEKYNRIAERRISTDLAAAAARRIG